MHDSPVIALIGSAMASPWFFYSLVPYEYNNGGATDAAVAKPWATSPRSPDIFAHRRPSSQPVFSVPELHGYPNLPLPEKSQPSASSPTPWHVSGSPFGSLDYAIADPIKARITAEFIFIL